MEAIVTKLEDLNKKGDAQLRRCKAVRFQAWKYAEQDEILAALIERILQTMKQDGFFESCKAKVEELVARFSLTKLIGEFSKKIVDIDVTQFFDELKHKKHLGFYDSFQEFFDRLIWTYLNWRPQMDASEITDDRNAALVVFVDDLDRCPRDRIPQVLEAVKLFMDREGCVFVIGAAGDIIENALTAKYGAEDAGKFMDKIVQVTFNLPQLLEKDFKFYLDLIRPDLKEDLADHLPLIISAMRSNPRRIKRFLNNLSLLQGILLSQEFEVDFRSLFFWSIIDYLAPSLRDDLKDNPRILAELKKHIRAVEKDLGDTVSWDIPGALKDNIPASFQPYIKDRVLVKILQQFDAEPGQLTQLAALSGIVQSPEEIKAKEQDGERGVITGEMEKEVPAGKFKYGKDKHEETIEKPFSIDVYPVTNRQYEKFIEAGGYREDDHWSEEGKTWREKHRITLPKYWDDKDWNQPEHPVVAVSYYEAEAFAAWADKRLPTEKEWERAARGRDGREYPWGNEFDPEKCNTAESKISKTTRVTRYPNGISPVGCYDMAGNVWELTSSWYDEEKTMRVLRGGSWYSNRDFARCAYRLRDDPDDRDYDLGFRCARTKK
jgi:formylglycine-generating enzyme required for sulfatase activity